MRGRPQQPFDSNPVKKTAFFNTLASTGATFSLIHQLTIGREVEQRYLEKYGEHLQTEEPIAAYVDNDGNKYAVFRFYPQVHSEDMVESAEDYAEELANVEDTEKKKLYLAGIHIGDFQFHVLDPLQPLTLDNLVLIDLELATPVKEFTELTDDQRESFLNGNL